MQQHMQAALCLTRPGQAWWLQARSAQSEAAFLAAHRHISCGTLPWRLHHEIISHVSIRFLRNSLALS